MAPRLLPLAGAEFPSQPCEPEARLPHHHTFQQCPSVEKREGPKFNLPHCSSQVRKIQEGMESGCPSPPTPAVTLNHSSEHSTEGPMRGMEEGGQRQHPTTGVLRTKTPEWSPTQQGLEESCPSKKSYDKADTAVPGPFLVASGKYHMARL